MTIRQRMKERRQAAAEGAGQRAPKVEAPELPGAHSRERALLGLCALFTLLSAVVCVRMEMLDLKLSKAMTRMPKKINKWRDVGKQFEAELYTSNRRAYEARAAHRELGLYWLPLSDGFIALPFLGVIFGLAAVFTVRKTWQKLVLLLPIAICIWGATLCVVKYTPLNSTDIQVPLD
jgi:hypothetical protein